MNVKSSQDRTASFVRDSGWRCVIEAKTADLKCSMKCSWFSQMVLSWSQPWRAELSPLSRSAPPEDWAHTDCDRSDPFSFFPSAVHLLRGYLSLFPIFIQLHFTFTHLSLVILPSFSSWHYRLVASLILIFYAPSFFYKMSRLLPSLQKSSFNTSLSFPPQYFRFLHSPLP